MSNRAWTLEHPKRVEAGKGDHSITAEGQAAQESRRRKAAYFFGVIDRKAEPESHSPEGTDTPTPLQSRGAPA